MTIRTTTVPTLPRPRRLAYSDTLVALLDEASGERHRLVATTRLWPNASLLGVAAAHWSALAFGQLEGDPVDVLDMLRVAAGDVDGVDEAPRAAAHRALGRAEALRTGLALLHDGAALDAGVLAAVSERLGDVEGGGDGSDREDGRRGGGGTASRTARLTRVARLLGDRSLPLLIRVALAQRHLGAATRRAAPDRRIGPLLLPLTVAASAMPRTAEVPLTALVPAGVVPAGVVPTEPVCRFPLSLAAQHDDYRTALGHPFPEPWVRFFLDAVRRQALDDARWAWRARQCQLDLLDGMLRDRATPTATATAEHLVAQPYLSAAILAASLGVSGPTARAAIDHLVARGLLVPTSTRRRDRYYVAPTVLAEVYGRPLTGGTGGSGGTEDSGA
ncbi:MAG: hypothetical protein ACRDYZ_12665 [Acidimicrobiales bacterium]